MQVDMHRVAAQSRKVDLDTFFEHEQHKYPVALSEYGQLRATTSKADVLTCLSVIQEPQYEKPAVDACVVDGPVIVNQIPPKPPQTYGDYCSLELAGKFLQMAKYVKRLDVVFDVYHKIRRKRNTRDLRARDNTGMRVSVRPDSQVYSNFRSFLRNDVNKTELFCLLADVLISSECESELVCTSLEGAITNSHPLDLSTLQPCTQEEADTRMFVHEYDISRCGYKNICIVSNDTDVVLIALCAFLQFECRTTVGRIWSWST